MSILINPYTPCPRTFMAEYVCIPDLDLDCLAVWKEGSEMFMYGKVTGPTIVTKEESYRCFVSIRF